MSGPALYALNADGRRLAVDPLDELLALIVGGKPSVTIAGFAFDDAEGESTVYPVALGSSAILEAIWLRLRGRRRGPLGDPDRYGPIVETVAGLWLSIGRPPTQAVVAEAMGYSTQGNFARAIRAVGWPGVLVLALYQLDLWHARVIARTGTGTGTTIEERRLLEGFARLV